jgi:uncharacterized protein YjbI with pentapeptide repeats
MALILHRVVPAAGEGEVHVGGVGVVHLPDDWADGPDLATLVGEVEPDSTGQAVFRKLAGWLIALDDPAPSFALAVETADGLFAMVAGAGRAHLVDEEGNDLAGEVDGAWNHRLYAVDAHLVLGDRPGRVSDRADFRDGTVPASGVELVPRSVRSSEDATAAEESADPKAELGDAEGVTQDEAADAPSIQDTAADGEGGGNRAAAVAGTVGALTGAAVGVGLAGGDEPTVRADVTEPEMELPTATVDELNDWADTESPDAGNADVSTLIDAEDLSVGVELTDLEVDAPGLDVPDVDVPDVDVPDIAAPDVNLPSVDLPSVDAPSLDLPDLAVSDVDVAAPDVDLPNVDLPNVDLPNVDLPSVDAPSLDLPDLAVPDVDVSAPEVDLPSVDLPSVDLPNVDLPSVDAPSLDLPSVDLPSVDAPSLDLPDLAVPDVDVSAPEVDLPSVDLPSVDLPNVDLPSADLPNVDLPSADLPNLDVSTPDVDLSTVDVSTPDIDLPDTGIGNLDLTPTDDDPLILDAGMVDEQLDLAAPAATVGFDALTTGDEPGLDLDLGSVRRPEVPDSRMATEFVNGGTDELPSWLGDSSSDPAVAEVAVSAADLDVPAGLSAEDLPRWVNESAAIAEASPAGSVAEVDAPIDLDMERFRRNRGIEEEAAPPVEDSGPIPVVRRSGLSPADPEPALSWPEDTSASNQVIRPDSGLTVERAFEIDPPRGSGVYLDDPEAGNGGEEVTGLTCSLGHLNAPSWRYCGTCGADLSHASPGRGPHPGLGLLLFDDGSTLPINTGYLIGRRPNPDAVGEGSLQALAVNDESQSVSRNHAILRVDGWELLISDCGSANGTHVEVGDHMERLEPGVTYPLSDGQRVVVGTRWFEFRSAGRE